MPTLTVLMGYPASGKTTIANKMVKAGAVRVNRDDIRAMTGQSYQRDLENGVREAEMTIARVALGAGFDVVVDDTNLTRHARNMWEAFANRFTAGQVEWKFIDTSLGECISRDARRQGSGEAGVGADVILGMRDNWRATKTFIDDRYGIKT